jgi:hypothetical protein
MEADRKKMRFHSILGSLYRTYNSRYYWWAAVLFYSLV